MVKGEFSKKLLDFARLVIHIQQKDKWLEGIALGGAGSTLIRKYKIQNIIREILPDHKTLEAIKMKDAIKNMLVESIILCKT